MKHKPVKKETNVVRCPSCQSDNVYYDADVVRSAWVGSHEKTEVGLHTCLSCNHTWHQTAPVSPVSNVSQVAPEPVDPVEVYPIEPEE